MKKRTGNTGFTLIEVVVAISIVAILIILSVSLYINQVRNGRRADATTTISEIALAEERYRMNNSQYGTLAQVWAGVATTPGGYYSLSLSGVNSTNYTITAQGIGDQAYDQEDGSSCSSLSLVSSNGVITKTPSVCWPQ